MQDQIQDQRKQTVDEVFNCFTDAFKKKFEGQLAALYVVGSYPLGKMSYDRPDLNFVVVLEGIDPEDHLLLGEVFKGAMKKFDEKVGIHPYFMPVRFIYPERRHDYNVFVSAVLLDRSKRDLSLPFGITRWVLQGYVNSRRLLAGKDIFEEVQLPAIKKKDLLERSLIDLEFFRLPLEKAPVQYRENEHDLLLGESIALGRAVVFLGVEIAMTEDELAKKEYLKFFEDHSLFEKFYKKRYDPETAHDVVLILDARKKFLKYKGDKAKVIAVYESALRLVDAVENKILQVGVGHS
ncbi:MAG: hypothetical protein ACD_63C00115G0008 [uncultured bacterium]|nr:MAG: hypothetical protein ACD_63C00115G0008 [uncultured bacterium]